MVISVSKLTSIIKSTQSTISIDTPTGQKDDANKIIDYIVLPFEGVKKDELFENLVPLQGTYTSSQVDIIAKKIIESKVNQVIFSAFEFGFDNLARRIKELNKDIKIKLFWHSSNSQINGQLVDSMKKRDYFSKKSRCAVGSTVLPFSKISKCRCAPSLYSLPVGSATTAMMSPCFTSSPTESPSTAVTKRYNVFKPLP